MLNHNNIHKENVKTILKEEFGVVGSDAVTNPVAVMIQFHCATIAKFAVTCSRWF
jgi:hypothetical protein